ncbi:MAG: hypothetical protein GY934_22805 [Gammaproteobacteria bacterium]|nr:hypothetical protein [Gammaproteobacteria bacterium]
MNRIVPDIDTLEQHIHEINHNSERYRPQWCPTCGFGGLWVHGSYDRYPDRGLESSGRLNPVPIPRYRCDQCGVTCSRLPSCIAPRRWYIWKVQQQVLLAVLLGESIRSVSRRFMPGRHTIRRWLTWLYCHDQSYRFSLASDFPWLERMPEWSSYWYSAMTTVSLDNLMTCLDNQGVTVP